MLAVASALPAPDPSPSGAAGGFADTLDAFAKVRTDPDGRGLVVSYVGGSCDGPVRMTVRKSPDRVDFAIQRVPPAGSSTPPPLPTCAAVGIPRTLNAGLQAPLGDRELYNGPHRVVPYDGARLLVPSYLPPGFEVVEEGDGGRRDGQPRTLSWSRTYASSPLPPRGGRECAPGYQLIVNQRPPDYRLDSSQRVQDRRQVGEAAAELRRDATSGRISLSWVTAGTIVTVLGLTDCPGPAPISEKELLRVARGLRLAHPAPAG